MSEGVEVTPVILVLRLGQEGCWRVKAILLRIHSNMEIQMPLPQEY